MKLRCTTEYENITRYEYECPKTNDFIIIKEAEYPDYDYDIIIRTDKKNPEPIITDTWNWANIINTNHLQEYYEFEISFIDKNEDFKTQEGRDSLINDWYYEFYNEFHEKGDD